MALLRADEETKVREWFAELARPVELFVGLGPEETPRAGAQDVDFGEEMLRWWATSVSIARSSSPRSQPALK